MIRKSKRSCNHGGRTRSSTFTNVHEPPLGRYERSAAAERLSQEEYWRWVDLARKSHMDEKRAIIESEKERRLTLCHIRLTAADFAMEKRDEARLAALEMCAIFEPGFMRRARQRRINLAKISRAEDDANRIVMVGVNFLID